MGRKLDKNKKDNLKDMNGHKFKNMWSTKIMYFFFFVEYCAFAMSQTACKIDANESIIYGDAAELIGFNIVMIVIMLLLIFINMKFLGREVAVANDKGIHSSAGFVAWKDIKSVKYHTRLPSKHMSTRDSYCSVSIFTANKEYEIIHAPRTLLWYIKKKKSDVRIKCDYGLLIFLICPFIFGIVIGLLNK